MQPSTVRVAGIEIPLQDTKCNSTNGTTCSVKTFAHYVVNRAVEFVCADSVFAILRLLAFLPAYSNYTIDATSYKEMSDDDKDALLKDMRSSAKEILERLQVDIVLQTPQLLHAFVNEDMDHSTTPTITFSGFLFNALSAATTQAEFEHLVLMFILTALRAFGHVWLQALHGCPPKNVEASRDSRVPYGKGDCAENVDLDLFGGIVNLVDLNAIDHEGVTRTTKRLAIKFRDVSPGRYTILMDIRVTEVIQQMLSNKPRLPLGPLFNPRQHVVDRYSPAYAAMVTKSFGTPSVYPLPSLTSVDAFPPQAPTVGFAGSIQNLTQYLISRFSSKSWNPPRQSQALCTPTHDIAAGISSAKWESFTKADVPVPVRGPAPFPRAWLVNNEITYTSPDAKA